MNMNTGETGGQDLPQLLDLLTNAVTTLDAAGVESYGDLYLYVTGCRGGQSIGNLAIENGRLSLEMLARSVKLPRYLHDEHEDNRRALLLAELCYIMWHWRWGAAEVSDYLGCTTAQLDGWIRRSQNDSMPALPEMVVHRMRRLAIIEHHRHTNGVSDAYVAHWVREPRSGFGGRSINDLLCSDGEAGFRRIAIWLLNTLGPSPTIH